MHVVWINEDPRLTGGAERYVRDTACLLRERGIRGTLLYDGRVATEPEPEMRTAFEAAFAVERDVRRQVEALGADCVYLHQWREAGIIPPLLESRIPTVRFFHDHQLFCLRDRKLTTIRRKVCTRCVGVACYPCLGFVNRSPRWPGVRLSTVAGLRRKQRTNALLDALVVGSGYMRDHVIAHGFAAEKVHRMPLYVDVPDDVPECERDRDLLLFVGQLVRGKALDVLLKALAVASTSPRLLVVGNGKQEDEYRSLSRHLGLEARVTFEPRKSRRDLFGLYRRAACVVYPSRNPETFGFVGPEAMSQATPVISTCIGGMSEWVEEGRNALVFPVDDHHALAGAIDRVMQDRSLARGLGEEGQRIFRERFQRHSHLTSLTELLETLTGSHVR